MNDPRSSRRLRDVFPGFDGFLFESLLVAYGEPTTNPSFGMPTNLDEHKHDDDELSDLTPVPNLYSGSTHSSSKAAQDLNGAADELAKTLLQDKRLARLCEIPLEMVDGGADKIEHNLAKLLVAFTVDLKAEANGILEIRAVQFIKPRVKYVAHCIRKHLALSKEEKYRKMHEVVLDSPRIEAEVELCLRCGLSFGDFVDIPATRETKNQDILQSKSGSHSASDGAQTEAADNSSLRNLEGVKDSILASSALVKLTESFRLFVSHEILYPKFHSHMPLGQSDLDVWLDEEMDADTSSVDSLEPDVNLRKQLESERLGSALAFIMLLLRWSKIVAEFLELKEKPLAPGFTRVRWTCVSKHILSNQRIMQGPQDSLQLSSVVVKSSFLLI